MEHLADRVYLWLHHVGLQKEAKKILKKVQKKDKIELSLVTIETEDPTKISSALNIPIDGFSPSIEASKRKKEKKIKAEEQPQIKQTVDVTETEPVECEKKSIAGTPFKRINPEEVDFAREELKNNDFSAKKGAQGSYGEKAYFDLKDSRGKDFKQEKNKKKKGSYKGGRIDTGVHSIKFDSD